MPLYLFYIYYRPTGAPVKSPAISWDKTGAGAGGCIFITRGKAFKANPKTKSRTTLTHLHLQYTVCWLAYIYYNLLHVQVQEKVKYTH